MFENSDDYDFSPAESSKLASLFGTSALSSSGSLNSNLSYTAPKQPTPPNSKKNEPSKPTSKPQTTIILAKVVSLWKLEDKDYKALGKHGLAIIGSEDLKIYEIIAYKEKNNVILRAKVNNDFQFYIQKDYFSSFYDNNSKNWLVKFEPEDQTEFNNVLEKIGAQLVSSGIDQDSTEQDESATKPDLLPKPTPNAEDQNSDSSGSIRRSNILNRMAKMGQQILPRQSVRNTSTDISDTEEEKATERKSTRKFKHSVPAEKIQPKKPAEEKQVVTACSSVDYIPSASSIVYSPPVQATPDVFSHYIVSQNMELKMHLSQMSAKLDSALLGCNRNVPSQDNDLAQSKIKALQLKLENMEAYLKDYEKKYLRLEIRYEDLAKQEQDKTEVKRLQEEISALRTQLSEQERQLEDLERTKTLLDECKLSVENKERLIEAQKLEIQGFEEGERSSKDQQATVEALNGTVNELREKLRESEEMNEEKAKTMADLLSKTIKSNMNKMYASILEGLDVGNNYSYAEIQATIAKHLKTTTFKIIDDMNVGKVNVNLSPTDLKPEA